MQKQKIIYNLCYLKIRPTECNIFITLTDSKGNVLLKSSAGCLKYKGKKKKTSYVAEMVLKKLLVNIEKNNIIIKLLVLQLYGVIRNIILRQCAKVFIENPFKSSLCVEQLSGFKHNGMRLPKIRRI